MPKPQIIFLAENHGDFSYIALADELIKTSRANGLSVEVFSEFKSQEEKIKLDGWNYPKPDGRPRTKEDLAALSDEDKESTTPDMKGVPSNWLEIARSVDGVLADGKMPGYHQGYGDEQDAIAMKIRTEETEKVAALDKDSSDYDANKTEIEKTYRAKWDQAFIELIAKRDADYVTSVKAGIENPENDIVIVWTGGAHVKPIMDGLGLDKEDPRVRIISNQDPSRICGLTANRFALTYQEDGSVNAEINGCRIDDLIASHSTEHPKKTWVEKIKNEGREKEVSGGRF